MKRLLETVALLLIWCDLIGAEENLEFSDVDVAKLATHTYGTEFLLLENSHYTEQKSYKFEDFFWTGSGDGPTDENMWTSGGPAIIYKTSTIISTVFVETPSTQPNESTITRPTNCSFNCDSPSTSIGDISPTPTIADGANGRNDDVDDDNDDVSNAHQQFWLLTVLRGDGKDPVIIDLKRSLVKLYKTAFQRQQAQHLGIVTRQKRTAIEKQPVKGVNVYIHEVNKQETNGEDKIEVLYHVEVLGKPVDAYTAANDMKLVTDEEVRKALGYPFVIKAEPYVKAAEPQGLSKAKNTWFVIGVSIIGVLLVLLVLAFLILGFTKRPRASQANIGIENRRHIFERGVGHENKGLVQDEETPSESQKARENSPTYINFGNQPLATSVVLRPQSSFSGTSSSSSSLDISPLMSLTKKHKTPPKKPPRPRAALNKTVPLNTTIRQLPPEVFDSDSGASRKDDSPDFGGANMDPGVMSPKSYLSMPSVKSFPRTNMPEPLNRVLEPVSVTHFDMPEGAEPISAREEGFRRYASETLVRHGSVGTVEDPGVIGPIVWNIHCERLKHGVSVDQGINDLKGELKSSSNISRMRKRFHDLLDDTFSLFGNSRKGSPESTPEQSRPIAIEVKSHSANDNRLTSDLAFIRPRPKTTSGAKTPDPQSSGPSCAWSSTAPSPLVRPLSAAPRVPSGAPSAASSRAPTAPGEPSTSELRRVSSGILKAPWVNVEHVLAEGKFRPSDPAISVIEAIKTELERVSLPGSSCYLNK